MTGINKGPDSGDGKSPESGDINLKTPKLVEAYLEERGLRAGNVEVVSSRLYNDFISYLLGLGLHTFPSIKGMGRCLTKRLPFKKGRLGTYYLVNATV